jgi:hypothetical protein
MFAGFPDRHAPSVNLQVTTPAHPVAPYPSNAVERPPRMYDYGDGAPGSASSNIGDETTAMLPPRGGSIPNPPQLGTDVNLQRGAPPYRIPRLYPNREAAGVRFSETDKSMGIPNGDLYFVPLPQIPKTTAIPSRVRAGYPQYQDMQQIPSVYVGGDALP